MTRVVLVVCLGLLATSGVRADLGPPKGLKSVTVDHKITTEKEFSDYAFFTIAGNGKAAVVTPVKFDPKTPIVISGENRGFATRTTILVAVPKDAHKPFGTEKDFHEALKIGKVEGFVKTKSRFNATEFVKDTDKRTSVTQEHTITAINAKDGIAYTTKKDAPKIGGGKQSPEEEEESATSLGPTAYTPRGGVWIAAVACFASLMFGGFWLAGRSRRKV